MRLAAGLLIAIFVGKLFEKVNLPAVLGWLLTGIVLSPFALGLITSDAVNTVWYKLVSNVVKFCVGAVMGLGASKRDGSSSGRKYLIIAMSESVLAFVIISAVFTIILSISGIPIFLAFIFGAIGMVSSLATSVAILKSYNSDGPVTRAAVPIMSLSSLLGIVVFMLVLGFSIGSSSAQSMSVISILLSLAGSVGSGLVMGILASLVQNKLDISKKSALIFVGMLLIASSITVNLSHWVFTRTSMNYLVAGIFFSITFSKRIDQEKQKFLNDNMGTASDVIFAFFILSLGLNINYLLILQAGVFTVLFIACRTTGILTGASLGGKFAGAEPVLYKNIGYMLLPHASICLIFMAIAVESLSGIFPAEIQILQGTLMAALLINELVSPLVMKRILRRAGELPQ